jgi:hypothetical protein
MTELHRVGISSSSNHPLEAVNPTFVKEGILKAQKKSWDVLNDLKSLMKIGITEDEARKLALQLFQDHGVTKHWHRPYIRFGAGTTLTFNDPLRTGAFLKDGDPYYLDLGPVWIDSELGLEYEGDVGDTFVFGNNPEAEKCAQTARDLFDQAKQKWKETKLDGKSIYEFLHQEASNRNYQLIEHVKGHRVSDFPHHRYSKSTLGDIDFCPNESLWVLEIQIIEPRLQIGAFYEDLL